MSLARRLLLVGSGGGVTFAPPTGNGVLTAGAITTIIDDSKYNAWPSLCRVEGSTVVMAYVKADNHNLDTSGKIVGRTSTDDGDSWGPEVVIADVVNGCINPGLLTTSSGRILCEFNEFNGSIDPPDCVRVVYSDDSGGTWSSPYTVDTSFTTQVASPASRPVQLADDTILLPIYGYNGGDWSSAVLFSTDDGATFSGQVTMANGTADGRNYFEPSIGVSGSTLIGHYRTVDAGNMYQNESVDGGATWNATAIAFGGYSPSNVYRRTTGTLVATVRGNAAAKLQAFTSIDDGASWDDQGILDSTSYTELEYACALDRLDGSILVVYSVQPTGSTSNADIKTVVVTEGS